MRERPVNRNHDADHVHVGRQDLGGGGVLERPLPAELGTPGQYSENLAVTRAVGSDPNPVACNRHAGIKRVGKVQELHAHSHQNQAAVNAHHPAGLAGFVCATGR